MLDEEQIQKRRPLWVALSELWLDTELSAEDLERIARVMADSDLSIEELRRVYCVEVAPVVSPNLLIVAGEWVGFDEEWLSSRIASNLRDRARRTRFWSWFPLTH
jgi:ornithine carbamoyltransferase